MPRVNHIRRSFRLTAAFIHALKMSFIKSRQPTLKRDWLPLTLLWHVSEQTEKGVSMTTMAAQHQLTGHTADGGGGGSSPRSWVAHSSSVFGWLSNPRSIPALKYTSLTPLVGKFPLRLLRRAIDGLVLWEKAVFWSSIMLVMANA